MYWIMKIIIIIIIIIIITIIIIMQGIYIALSVTQNGLQLNYTNRNYIET